MRNSQKFLRLGVPKIISLSQCSQVGSQKPSQVFPPILGETLDQYTLEAAETCIAVENDYHFKERTFI